MFIRPPKIVRRYYSDAVWRLPQQKKTIYLTFDDGPVQSVTSDVLDILKNYNLEATFFCLGEQIHKYPKIFSRIVDEGHSIGNHGYKHLHGRKVDSKVYLANALKGYYTSGSSLFRPPYGYLKRVDYKQLKIDFRVVFWDIMCYDFSKKVSPEKCYENITSNVRNGSIVVFHDTKKSAPNMFYSLKRLIEDYLDQGYEFKRITDQLL